MDKRVKSHFVPRGYLKGFTNDEDKLHILSKNNESIREGSPKSVNYQLNYYVVDTVDEEDSMEVERTLGKVESVSLPLLKKLSDAEINNHSEWADIAIYIALQYERTPSYRKKIDKVIGSRISSHTYDYLARAASDESIYNELVKFSNENIENTIAPTQSELKELLTKDINFKFNLDNGRYVKMFFEDAYHSADAILQKQWRVMHTEEDMPFLTSDSPVIPHNYSLERRSATPSPALAIPDRIYFPIDQHTCLIIFGDTKNKGSIDHYRTRKQDLRKINSIVYDGAEKYVIGPDSISLKKAKKN